MSNRPTTQFFIDHARHWPALLAAVPALGALALLWRVRDTPLALGWSIRIDALSSLFLLALFGGCALALAAQPAQPLSGWLRPIVVSAALALAFSTTLTPAIAGAYVVLALLTLNRHSLAMQPDRPLRTQLDRAVWGLRRIALAAPGLLAAACLLLGYGALALHGAARYDDRAAGLALDSFAFWFVLLAAVIACSPIFQPTNDERRTKNERAGERRDERATAEDRPLIHSPTRPFAPPQPSWFNSGLFRFAWLYPLARLYSLGPWNAGWSFATLLLGGGVALWCACSALAHPDVTTRNARAQSIYLALALAGLGLSTSAGVAAACYGVLAYLVLAIGYKDWRVANRDDLVDNPLSNPHPPTPIPLPWLLSSAIPLTAPFVAAWMLIGAGVAGGVALLAGVAWLVALLHGLMLALRGDEAPAQARRQLLVAGATSLLLGVGAPLIVRALIRPVVGQLQGGLTPYGDANIWPWVGLAASDSAHTQVTTLPSIAIALLMLVLSALVHVVARLRRLRRADEQGAPPDRAPATTLSNLRDEVPWLGGLLGPDPGSQRQPGDGE
ncbi:MAG TPA: hypothetical protein VFU22_23550 [Roseiflexaceae bacterium]|nr:hypothetical protein [Roseiflexaceae bacterium]